MYKGFLNILLFFSLLFSRVTTYAQESADAVNLSPDSHELLKLYSLSSSTRKAILNPDRIVKTLNIKPEMNILDIGAGTGFFAFRFAEVLKGTGKVFATESDSNMVQFMQKKINGSGYKNIFPIYVQPRGIDPFYKQHSFDIIFISVTYPYLYHPKKYFQELRPSLVKGKGRLYIIQYKNTSDISEAQFGSFKEITKVLSSQDENHPIFHKLRKEIQAFIKNWQGEDIPPEIRAKIIQDFNKILLNRSLFYEMIDYYSAKGTVSEKDSWTAPLMFIVLPEDLQLAKWLIVHLDANGVFDKRLALSDEDKEQLRKLNAILLSKIFGINKISSLRDDYGPTIHVEKKSILLTMKAAGYQFVREHDFLTYHYFLEYKRND